MCNQTYPLTLFNFSFVSEIHMLILNFISTKKRLRMPKTTLKRENEFGRFTLPDLRVAKNQG